MSVVNVTNPLEQLAGHRAVIMLDAQTLLEYLHRDREETYMEGVREGHRLAEMAARASGEEPYTKEEAARVLGFSEGTIDNMRSKGELESYEYGGRVRIEKAEVERFKRTHANLYCMSRTFKNRKQ